MSFESPEAALDAVAACLAKTSDRIHKGLLNTGEGLECCPGQLLRVESSTLRPVDGGAITLYGLARNRCKDLVMEIVVTYAECWQAYDGDGPEAIPIANATSAGVALMDTWWVALQRLACCTGTNQLVRFLNVQDRPPDGPCAGWEMRLEADVSICDCSAVE
jgi:hypothetical protein